MPPRKTNTWKQAVFGPKIWTKISHSTKNVNAIASFKHTIKREILSKLCRQTNVV